jgi:phosphodiesterase/alkaline phosphatase D-like protein
MIARRTLLKLLSASATAACAPASTDGPDDTDAPFTPDPRTPAPTADWPDAQPAGAGFPEGPFTGDPLPDGLIAWTRYDGAGDVVVRWATWDGAAWSAPEEADVDVADGGFIHADLPVPADVWVAVQFADADGASRVALGRSAPPEDAAPVVHFGACSCTSQGKLGDFPSLTLAASRAPLDAFIFLGDTAYFDGLSTRAAYRALWASTLARPGYGDLLDHVPGVFTWDDHEVDNNFDPETIDPDLLNTAVEAFFEHLPLRRPTDHPTAPWRRLRFGTTVELFVLDCRSERRASEGRYVSQAQLDWLIDGLQTSPCTWKLIANSVPIADLDNAAWDVPVAKEDRWEGYPADRARLLGAITEGNVRGVVFVSGDVHCPMLARVTTPDGGPRVWDLVVGPGGSFLNPLGALTVDGESVVWGDVFHNAAHIALSPDGTLTCTWVDEDDRDVAVATLDVDGTLRALRWTDRDTDEVSSL